MKHILIFLGLLLVLMGSYVYFHSRQQLPLANVSTTVLSQPTPTPYPQSAGALPDPPLQIADGYSIHIFAQNLGHPRVLQFSPGGTLLVSDPDGNRVWALPDTDHNGVADQAKIVISGENHVHGLAPYQGKLFVADVDKVVRFDWNEQYLAVSNRRVLFSLPQNSDHNDRTIVFDQGGKMFISIGATCDVCQETPEQGGSIWVSDAQGETPQIYATGLRDAAFMAFNPLSGKLWVTEMGRDYLGDNIPPDEINIVQEGGDYGWPYCYGDQVHDDQFDPSKKHSCTNTIAPIYQVPAHSAPLGLTFINSAQFPQNWQQDLLVAYHGSWNRPQPVGYKLVHLQVSGDSITGAADFLTGFAPSSTPNRPGNLLNSAV
ncbi:PQQ-dependent sugar dehydrogenase, partial [Patescibacteria group bacterium]|nr:PQQ-dependent sugar dehydrogenase [Patescibacteria group bacterium]